jgi:chemotaxis protein MotB
MNALHERPVVVGPPVRVIDGSTAMPSWPLTRHRSLRTPRRRRRGQRDADHAVQNHATDRWMISYADFITLLFAFFVVMYATTSVDRSRFRMVSGALSTAFSPADPKGIVAQATPAKPATPAIAAPALTKAEGNRKLEATAKTSVPEAKSVPIDPIAPEDRAEIAKNAERVEHMKQLATRVDEHLQTLVRDGQVQVRRGAHGIAIEINAAVLFDPAKADLKPESFAALRSLAQVLSQFVEPLQIEGHSDDVPIATREFRSNWELSAARAASVGRFLIDQGVAPNRIGIAGYAEFRPLASNIDAGNRARNRRVTLLVMSADETRPQEGPAAGDRPGPR